MLFFVESDLRGVFAGMVMCPLSASLSILSLSLPACRENLNCTPGYMDLQVQIVLLLNAM